MKIKKIMPLLSVFSLSILSPITFAVSCSNNQTNNEQETISLKNYLDSFLSTKFQSENNNNNLVLLLIKLIE